MLESLRVSAAYAARSAGTQRVFAAVSPRALLNDEVSFVLLLKERRWSGTTLVRTGCEPIRSVGESARIISSSAKFDRRKKALGTSKSGLSG